MLPVASNTGSSSTLIDPEHARKPRDPRFPDFPAGAIGRQGRARPFVPIADRLSFVGSLGRLRLSPEPARTMPAVPLQDAGRSEAIAALPKKCAARIAEKNAPSAAGDVAGRSAGLGRSDRPPRSTGEQEGYWSNEFGWVGREGAEAFTTTERSAFRCRYR
jgi:hypothetical protein